MNKYENNLTCIRQMMNRFILLLFFLFSTQFISAQELTTGFSYTAIVKAKSGINLPEIENLEIIPRAINKSNDTKTTNIFPNPFNNLVNIEVVGHGEIDIEVLDVMGNHIYSLKSQGSNISIPTDSWNQGMYIFRILKEGETIYSKIMYHIK